MQADRVLWWRSAGAHAPCIPLGALLAQRIAQRSRVPACLQRSQLGQWNPIPPEQCGQFSCKPLERSASNNIDETFSKVSKFIFILDAEFEFLKARLALRRRLRLPAHSGHLRPPTVEVIRRISENHYLHISRALPRTAALARPTSSFRINPAHSGRSPVFAP